MTQQKIGVLQKLLWPAQVAAIVREGGSVLRGPVTRAGDVADVSSPAQLVAAHGLDALEPYGAHPTHVDVLRFPVTPTMRLLRPSERSLGQERPWPTYPSGFLPAEVLAPVWWLDTTRVPAGAEVWRLEGGRERLVLKYFGPAAGWRGADGWSPPLTHVGPHARWHGEELLAAFGSDDPAWIELMVYEDRGPGWERARPHVWHRMVPAAECDVVEVVLGAEHAGRAWRVLHRHRGRVVLELRDDDPEVGLGLGATMQEPGVFELEIDESQVTLTDTAVVSAATSPRTEG